MISVTCFDSTSTSCRRYLYNFTFGMPSAQQQASSYLQPGWSVIRNLVLDRRYFWHLAAHLVFGELLLGLIIIWRVPCAFPFACYIPHYDVGSCSQIQKSTGQRICSKSTVSSPVSGIIASWKVIPVHSCSSTFDSSPLLFLALSLGMRIELTMPDQIPSIASIHLYPILQTLINIQ